MESLWLLFVVIAQFFNAIVVLLDKYIVTSKSSGTKPVVYTFYTSLLSGAALVLLPFGAIHIPSFIVIWLSLSSALSFLISVLCLYESLQYSAPSEVTPIVGGISAISTFAFSFIILGNPLPTDFFIGFGLLVVGMILISHFNLTLKSFAYLLFSGIGFGLSIVLIKAIFMYDDSFANGFFWSRMANVLGAFALLLWPGNIRAITHNVKHGGKKGKYLILSNKVLAGVAFLLILVATKLGDHVALVNALSSLQYVFLLIFAFIFPKRMREYLSEKRHKREMLHKLAATSLIIVGFVILFT